MTYCNIALFSISRELVHINSSSLMSGKDINYSLNTAALTSKRKSTTEKFFYEDDNEVSTPSPASSRKF